MHRAAFWSVVAAAFVLLAWNTGTIPLLDPDEARFARTSVEMLRGGDLVVPQFEGQPRLVKPPLMHWIQSALFSVLGTTPWVARIHALLATLGSLLLTGWIARNRLGPEGAAWAVAFLATMPLVVAIGHLGTLDALLAVHVLAAVALDLAGIDRPSPYRSLALGALLGLAFLVKGPVGVILPLVMMLAGRTAAGMSLLPGWAGLARGIAGWSLAVLPWGLAFLGRPWFYLLVAAVGFLPWSAPLAAALGRVIATWRDPATRGARYTAAALIAGLLFFSVSSSKLATYILPLAPLAALLVAWGLGRELQTPRRRGWGAILLVATLGLSALGLGLAGGLRLQGVPRQVALLGSAVHAMAALVAAHGLFLRRPRQAYGAAASGAALFLLLGVALLLPDVTRTRTAAWLVAEVPGLKTAPNVAVVDMKVPSLTWYLDRVPEQVDLAHLPERLGQADGTLYVFDWRDLSRVPPASLERLREVGRQGKYRVFALSGD